MQGHQQFIDKIVLRFRLAERVPKQNLYRRLCEVLDWEFMREQTRFVYSHTGQPSLDPVVFFKLVLVLLLNDDRITDDTIIPPASAALKQYLFAWPPYDSYHSIGNRAAQPPLGLGGGNRGRHGLRR